MHPTLERLMARFSLRNTEKQTQPADESRATDSSVVTTKTDREITTSAAYVAVLGTCELLEGILSHLPLRDLFVIQRVSRTWRDVTKQSITLRKKMFLAADGPPYRDTSTTGPSFYDAFHSPTNLHITFNPTTSLRVYDGQATVGHKETFHQTKKSVPLVEIRTCKRDDWVGMAVPVSNFNPSPKPAASSSSWRDMFLTQPPITMLGLTATLTVTHQTATPTSRNLYRGPYASV